MSPQPRCSATQRGPHDSSHRFTKPRLCQKAVANRQHVVSAVAAGSHPALLYDFHDQLIPYEQAWSWQKQRLAELCSADTQDRRDTIFLLQHPPVYTLGAGSNDAHIKFDLQQPPHPLYRTERGGEVTYHGPGQLVMYPLLDLTRHTPDLHWYLRGLEEVIIRALAETSGLQGKRIPGLTGVWVDGAKLAAIGVRARKWVTYHGLALNVSTQLQPFRLITPCGIADRPVGSVRSALSAVAAGASAGGDEGASAAHESSSSSSSSSSNDAEHQGGLFSSGSSSAGSRSEIGAQQRQQLFAVAADSLIIEYRYALLAALEDVFGFQLQPATDQELQQLQASASSYNPASSSTGTAEQSGVLVQS